MQRLIISSATAVLFGVGLAAPQAKAEQNYGPVQKGTQCFTVSPGPKNEFGYWGACPGTAAQQTPNAASTGATQPAPAAGSNGAAAGNNVRNIPRNSRAQSSGKR
jgi:hypothetical protein